MKLLIKITAGLIIAVIIAYIAIGFYIYNLAVSRSDKGFLAHNLNLSQPVLSVVNPNRSETPEEGTDWFNHQPYKEVNIISDDGLKLTAYYLPAQNKTDKTVILAHGYSSQGTFMGAYAKFYHQKLGYNVLSPDDRGHGKSEGKSIGFGWTDRKDYLKWIDWVIHKVGNNSNIVLHGVSMGGSAVLMTSGEKLPDNVKAIVSDCAYTSLKDELAYQFNKMYKLPSFPVMGFASILTKIKAGYFLGEASTVKQVKKSNTPTLFIHGSADNFVPSSMVSELYKACNSQKELWIVQNADHGDAYFINCDAYIQRVKDFIGKYVK